MYLPSDDETQRREITQRFLNEYCGVVKRVGLPVNAASHWAKLERPHTAWQILDMHMNLNAKYPLARFNEIRGMWDPHNLLTSPSMTRVIGLPKQSK